MFSLLKAGQCKRKEGWPWAWKSRKNPAWAVTVAEEEGIVKESCQAFLNAWAETAPEAQRHWMTWPGPRLAGGRVALRYLESQRSLSSSTSCRLVHLHTKLLSLDFTVHHDGSKTTWPILWQQKGAIVSRSQVLIEMSGFRRNFLFFKSKQDDLFIISWWRVVVFS